MTTCNLTRKQLQLYRHDTFAIDQQRLWECDIKFARRQHPAMGRGATFVVPSTTFSVCFHAADEMGYISVSFASAH